MTPSGRDLVVWFVELADAQLWTQEVAAAQLGIDQTTIGEWKRRVAAGDPPSPRGNPKRALVDLYLRVQEKPFARFRSALVADAVARAERPGAFHGFRRQPSSRDKLGFIYNYVLRRGGVHSDLSELDAYRDEILGSEDSNGTTPEDRRETDSKAPLPHP